jgi:DNA-binding GntR family transcriptional regulator
MRGAVIGGEDETTTGRRRMPRSSRLDALAHGQPHTASFLIRRALRADIIALRLKPGVPLVEKEIAETYGVSRTPVREAVLRLADEGLVDIFPQSGTFVSRIPVHALPEAIIIRKSLEETTARMAAERASRSQIAGLRAVMERQREMAAADDRDGFHQADEAFHAGVADAAGYPGIWTLVQQVKLQVDRYRRLTLPEDGRLPRVISEHDAILAGIEAHDPDRAAAGMGGHLGALLAEIGGIQGHNPDYFVDAVRPQGF